MLFFDETILIDKAHSKVKARLEIWRQTMEAKGFRLIRTNIEYLE